MHYFLYDWIGKGWEIKFVNHSIVLDVPGLICFWDFQEPSGSQRVARGRHAYELTEMAGAVDRVEGGIFGPYAAYLKHGQWFSIPRSECPALNIHGPKAQVSVIAWIKRYRKPEVECEFVAGMWNETQAKRQYGMFLDLRIHNGADQVGCHVSGTGGPSEGSRWCMESSIGATKVDCGEKWHCAGISYDGRFARSYYNGVLDENGSSNPYSYDKGLYDGGVDGANFTVGAVDRLESIGNWFTGIMGGIAVFDRALTDDEMKKFSPSK